MPGHVVHAVRSAAFAGVERYICDVSPELVSRGWQVTVIGGDPDRMSGALPSEVRHLPAATTMDVARALRSTSRPDVVHTHMTAAEVGAWMAWPLSGPRWVSTRHFAGPRGSTPARQLALRPLVRRIDCELAISRFVGSAVDCNPTILMNGVPDQPASGESRGQQILVAQRLESEKATEVALEGWARSGLAGQGWSMVVAGEGSQRGRLEAAAPPGVRFVGFTDLGRWRRTSAIFLSTAPAEPFGLSVVEAMAAGLPIIAADGGAHPETVGSSGVLVPPGDVSALAHALTELASDPARRQELGASARARQRAHFALPTHVERLEGFYRG